MAPEAPAPPPPARGERPRGWHEYGNYRLVHRNQMDRLIASGIVSADEAEFGEETDARGEIGKARLGGRVHTASGAVLSVEKEFEVRYRRGRAEVRTVEYRYHTWLPGPPRRDLFRYDNCHGGLDTLHRHGYGADGREEEPVPAAHAALPWLSEAIEEAHRLGAASSAARR